jgi:hypothetical protein
MKKIIFRNILFASIIISFGSCAFHSGMIQGSAILQSNNFVYIKRDVSGTSVANYVLGIGGLTKDELVAEAKKNLIIQNQIKDNQTLVNITVGWKRTVVYPLVVTNRCTLSADIIEFK